jgi:predicted protein tyrosine phosphatase
VNRKADIKILFICSQNKWRSRTAEKIYEGFPGYQVRSAGTEPGARVRVTEGDIGWADLIFVMERRHTDRLRAKFPEATTGKPIFNLRISDDFPYLDPQLIMLLKARLGAYIDVPE